jgi:zinc protease
MIMSILTRGVFVGALCIAASASAQRAPVKLPPKPEPAAAKPYVYPTVTVDSLANGLRFAVIENHEMPFVAVRTALAGVGPLGVSFLDPAGKPGTIGLMLSALREGTTLRSSAAITDEMADLGTEVFFTGPSAFTPPWFRAAKSTWEPSLRLLADVLMNPTFPAAGITRLQGTIGTTLDRLPPVSLGQRILYGTLYGVDGPYNQFATSATIRGITREDLVAAQQQYLRPQNMLIVIGGDVTLREARQALTSAFGSWQRGGTTVTPIVPTPVTRAPTTIYLKDSPGLAQTIVLTGQLLPGRDHADAAAIEALASVLGDFTVSAGSRVYNAFRIERGLAYSSRVELIARPVPEMAPLVGTMSVTPATTDTAVMLWQKVIQDLRQARPATESELEFSKRNLIGRLPAQSERIDFVAFDVLASLRDRLPPDYLNKWIGRINNLTLAEVQAAAAKYLDPDHTVIVVVGDRAKIEAPLRATGIPVVIVEK